MNDKQIKELRKILKEELKPLKCKHCIEEGIEPKDTNVSILVKFTSYGGIVRCSGNYCDTCFEELEDT